MTERRATATEAIAEVTAFELSKAARALQQLAELLQLSSEPVDPEAIGYLLSLIASRLAQIASSK